MLAPKRVPAALVLLLAPNKLFEGAVDVLAAEPPNNVPAEVCVFAVEPNEGANELLVKHDFFLLLKTVHRRYLKTQSHQTKP